jgi:hypothetical protein
VKAPAALLALVIGVPGILAAEPRPIVYTSLSPRSVTVGQPVSLTVDVFVPSYFLGAPRFPTLEVKDAVVVFLETGGVNLNERVGEQDYAGQRRSYLIYPQRAGKYEVPPVEVKVKYAIEGKASPPTPATGKGGSFTATIPASARGLPYFIATPSFQLSGTVEPALEGLRVGDSFERTITMTATEAFAMMLPPLEFPALDGLGVYPAQPQASDSSGERGATRVAKRVESVTYLLRKQGQYRLPKLEIAWWDTYSKQLRRAELPELVFDVAANPGLKADIPLPADPSLQPPPPDPWKPWREALRRHGPRALLGLLILALVYRVFRARIHAAIRGHRARVRERAESPEAYLERVRQAAQAGPAALLAATYRYLDRRQDGTEGAARLDRFAVASADAAFSGLAEALVRAALSAAERAPSGEAFAEALARAASPRSDPPAPGALEPLNPR